MPKETFLNLPETKQRRVIDAAIDEFAGRSYHKARITAIADKAGIAMGSFYQYFNDKEDLFSYLIELTVKKKLKYINHEMMINKDKYDIFQLLRETYLSGLRFARENPRLVEVGNILINDKEIQRKIWGEHSDKSSDFFRHLLEEGVKKGDLDEDIDVELVAKLLTGLNYSLVDLIYKDGRIDLENFDDEMEVIDKMLYFIENGIKKK
ncbi:MAG: TetR/AcrR family transcriptional regulator [Halanaerobiales bacterium]